LGKQDVSQHRERIPSVNDAIQQGRAKLIERRAKDLRVVYDNTEAYLSEITKADLGSDGVAEILIWVETKAIGGTLAAGDLIVLQKKRDRFHLYK
jgi:hypothetical protein